MPPVIRPNTARVEMIYSLGGERVQNVYHVHEPTQGQFLDLAAIATLFRNWENTNGRQQRVQDCGLDEVRVTDLSTATGSVFVLDENPLLGGTRVGDSAPNNVTLAVKANIGGRGRGRRGRTFWISLLESLIENNTVDNAYASDIVAAMNALRTQVLGAGLEMVVLHTERAGVTLNPAEASPITSYSLANNSVDSQRTRLPFHRRRRRPSGT